MYLYSGSQAQEAMPEARGSCISASSGLGSVGIPDGKRNSPEENCGGISRDRRLAAPTETC
jgi:hypothetical protein